MSQTSPRSQAGTTGLRLFEPNSTAQSDRPVDRLSPQLRLAQLWEIYGKAVVCKAKKLSPETIAMYDDTIAYWSALTPDRAIEDIAEDDGADFLEGLRFQPGIKDEYLSPRTVARHAKDLQRILDLAGPRTRYGKWGRYCKGIVSQVPYIEPPEVPIKLPNGDFKHEEVLALLAACNQAKLHEDYPGDPAVFWRALITFLCATGLRIRETMDLRWEMISRQTLLIPAAIAKTKQERATYVPKQALDAIESLRGLAPTGKHRIFPWPNWPSAGAWRWLHRRREQLVIAAGLPEGRRFGFHGFRKYYGTAIFKASEGSGASVAQFALGHTNEATTLGHYINADEQLGQDLARQRSVVDRLPLFRVEPEEG